MRSGCYLDIEPRWEAARYFSSYHPCSPANSKEAQWYIFFNAEIASKIELYIDGGVKTGSDIFKCLALGADFVFLGRGFLFSVTEGAEGIRNAFDILKK